MATSGFVPSAAFAQVWPFVGSGSVCSSRAAFDPLHLRILLGFIIMV
jgi:hypothetical protein